LPERLAALKNSKLVGASKVSSLSECPSMAIISSICSAKTALDIPHWPSFSLVFEGTAYGVRSNNGSCGFFHTSGNEGHCLIYGKLFVRCTFGILVEGNCGCLHDNCIVKQVILFREILQLITQPTVIVVALL
jgi:hypothetical protein